MKERPILFSAPMVRAILAGQKTQTRRVVKPQPYFRDRVGLTAPGWCWESPAHLGPKLSAWSVGEFPYELAKHCPYGVPGDRLWVRETLQPDQHGADYVADGALALEILSASTTDEQVEWWNRKAGDDPMISPAVPSIFMPRWASRITLEVTEVRVQRVQEIDEDDAIAEGIKTEDLPRDPDNFHPPGSYGYVSGLEPFPKGAIWPRAAQAYRELWDSINYDRGFGWQSNPWVWAITFRRLA